MATEELAQSQDTELTRQSYRHLVSALAALEGFPEKADLSIRVAETNVKLELPGDVITKIAELLRHLAEGSAVSIIPVHSELTTQQAADILNVSRPFVVALIDSGKLPCSMVGTHRRVRYSDLLEYQEATRKRSNEALQAMSDNAVEIGETD